MVLAFRVATEADLPAIVSIIEAAYSHYIPILGGSRPRPMEDDHPARIDRGETYLLEDGGEPRAVTSMAPEDGAMHIFNIAVHPEAQGNGHLRRILDFAEERARAAGLDRLTLYTNALMERNRAIYPHMGFSEVRQEDVAGGFRVVLFEKPVTAR